MTYAKTTSVPIERTEGAIKKTLLQHGADEIGTGLRANEAVFLFRIRGRPCRITLPLPKPEGYVLDARGRRRPAEAQRRAYEQETRSRYRALYLVIRAKLESVEAGINTFEREFLAHTLLPNGATIAEELEPKLKLAIETRRMPTNLLGFDG